MPTDSLVQLIEALEKPARLPHPVTRFELIETHISYVLLTGDYVYKFKKPVKLEFLDFSSLDKRRYYCEEELRLNRRLAPEIYLEVIRVTGTPEHPILNGEGPAIEYALKMRQFSQSERLDRVLQRGELHASHLEDLAGQLAVFHDEATVAQPDEADVRVQAATDAMEHNFEALADCPQVVDPEALSRLHADNNTMLKRIDETMRQRVVKGKVRECHGDLHLANIALHDGRPLVFDCIEFNPALRWIDVMSETAFLVMDLQHRGHPEFGWRFLNAYLAANGDYGGLRLLPLYLTYRAMVRAKVACIRLRQPDCTGNERSEQETEVAAYFDLARNYSQRRRPCMLITCGLSGSGKSTIATELAATLGAIHIRSDVERKRLAGLAAGTRSGSGLDSGLYTASMHEQTYGRLLELAQEILAAGYPVIIDAAFLRRAQREQFRQLAADSKVQFHILMCRAPLEVLEKRVSARLANGRDASEADLAVLRRQLETAELPGRDESAWTLELDSAQRQDYQTLRRQLASACGY